MTGSPELARTASTAVARRIATAATMMAQAADAGVRFTFQGRSAEGADNWAVTDGHVAVFGDGGGYGDGRVSIGLADIDSGTNLVGPGARKACYSPLPGFPVRDGCLHAKALGVRLDGERLCLALQPGSNLQNLLFSQIACAPNVASDLGQTGARITGVLPPTFVEGDPDYLMAVAKGGDSFLSAPCDVILMRTAGGATGPVQYWDGNSFSSWRAAARPVFTTASCGRAPGVIKVGPTYRMVIAESDLPARATRSWSPRRTGRKVRGGAGRGSGARRRLLRLLPHRRRRERGHARLLGRGGHRRADQDRLHPRLASISRHVVHRSDVWTPSFIPRRVGRPPVGNYYCCVTSYAKLLILLAFGRG